MRYFDPASGRVTDAPNARVRFFFLGPFFLLWLRLWPDAAVSALLIAGAVHGSMAAVAAALGMTERPSVDAVLRASTAVRAAADRGISADAAFRELIAASLPFYAAALALLIVMGILTFAVPSYLRWRFRQLGFVELVDEETESVIDPEM